MVTNLRVRSRLGGLGELRLGRRRPGRRGRQHFVGCVTAERDATGKTLTEATKRRSRAAPGRCERRRFVPPPAQPPALVELADAATRAAAVRARCGAVAADRASAVNP
jgi:hypothetical protein